MDNLRFHALILSFADTRTWYQKPMLMTVMFLSQLTEFAFIEKIVSRILGAVLNSLLVVVGSVVIFSMITMILRCTAVHV